MAAKIAEVKCNYKISLVQIKMNKGPNHTLKGCAAAEFTHAVDSLVSSGLSQSDAARQVAEEYLEAIK